MKNRFYKQVWWWLIIFFLLILTGWLTWKNQIWSWLPIKKKVIKLSKNQQKEAVFLLHFYFRIKEKIWILPNYENFFISQTKRVSKKIFLNWKLTNYLDWWWKGWRKNFFISPATLEKRGKKNNYITFQPRSHLKIWKKRATIKEKDLNKLGLNKERFNLSFSGWKAILSAIKDTNQPKKAVIKIINYYSSNEKKSQLLIKKLANNLWDW